MLDLVERLAEYLQRSGEIEEFERRSARRRAGLWLGEIRRRLGLTQAMVAERMGVSQRRVSAIENGEIGRPSCRSPLSRPMQKRSAGTWIWLVDVEGEHIAGAEKRPDALALLNLYGVDDPALRDDEVILYPRGEWNALLKGVNNGEFDFFAE